MSHFLDVAARPDLYDLMYEGFDEDIPMYITLAQGHETVLECGIGSGRIAIPMALAGKTVIGIDNSTEMLKALEKKLATNPDAKKMIRAYKADMRNFDLGQKFSLIYVPFSTFNYLLSVDDQIAALTAFKKHLIPQGKLVLELVSFSLFPMWLNNDNTVKKAFHRVDSETGEVMEMWRVFRFDSSTQIIEQDRHFRFYDSKGILREESIVLWKNRFFLYGEMELLLNNSGFKILHTYGDCKFGPYRHESEFFVIEAVSI